MFVDAAKQDPIVAEAQAELGAWRLELKACAPRQTLARYPRAKCPRHGQSPRALDLKAAASSSETGWLSSGALASERVNGSSSMVHEPNKSWSLIGRDAFDKLVSVLLFGRVLMTL